MSFPLLPSYMIYLLILIILPLSSFADCYDKTELIIDKDTIPDDNSNNQYELLVDSVSGNILVNFDTILDLVTEHSTYKYVFESLGSNIVGNEIGDRADAVYSCFMETQQKLDTIIYQQNKKIPRLSTGDIYTRCNQMSHNITISMLLKQGKSSYRFPFNDENSPIIPTQSGWSLFCN